MITLNPGTEARLREKAEREGQDIDTVANSLIIAALEWEAWDRADAIAAVKRSDQAVAEGRTRPFSEFLAEQRVNHGHSPDWPYDGQSVKTTPETFQTGGYRFVGPTARFMRSTRSHF